MSLHTKINHSKVDVDPLAQIKQQNRPKQISNPCRILRKQNQTLNFKLYGSEKQLLGENFGARDPYPAEKESNFCEKVLGNQSTEHIIKPPEQIKEIIGLAYKQLQEDSQVNNLTAKQVDNLSNQISGWRLDLQNQTLTQTYKLKNAESSKEFKILISEVIRKILEEESDKKLGLDIKYTEDGNSIELKLLNKELGSLTQNEFIIAARINELKFSDLLQPKRVKYWA